MIFFVSLIIGIIFMPVVVSKKILFKLAAIAGTLVMIFFFLWSYCKVFSPEIFSMNFYERLANITGKTEFLYEMYKIRIGKASMSFYLKLLDSRHAKIRLFALHYLHNPGMDWNNNPWYCTQYYSITSKEEQTYLAQKLLPLLDNMDPAVRTYSALLLYVLGYEHEKNMAILIDGCYHSESRQYAAALLTDLADERAYPVAMELLKSEDIVMQRFAVEILGKIASNEAFAALKENSGKGKPFDPIGLALLINNGNKEAVKVLKDELRSADIDIRVSALQVLGGVRVKTFVPELIEAVSLDYSGYEGLPDAQVRFLRKEVVKALGLIGDESALLELKTFFSGEEKYLEKEICKSLTLLGDISWLPEMKKRLLEPSIGYDAARIIYVTTGKRTDYKNERDEIRNFFPPSGLPLPSAMWERKEFLLAKGNLSQNRWISRVPEGL